VQAGKNYQTAYSLPASMILTHCAKTENRAGTRVAALNIASMSSPGARIHRQTDKESGMNWDRVEGNWKQMTGKVKQQWGKLTDDTLAQINGQRDELVGKIQEAYGISRDEADRQVKDWEKLH
jgi:uncharacterized protein YjbJ (UPF0337 family)